MTAAVVRAIRRGGPLAPGDRVAVAVSGGSDSVALTWLLHELEADLGIVVAGLIHVNHQLRGAESDLDEQFCQQLAQRLNLPCEVARVDVAGLARARRCSVEVAAREARYQVFEDARIRLGADVVATGHTMDDQAETVLLRVMRGAGARGLAGIRARRGRIVRPLLQCRREDLRGYLEARGESWRDDASNRDVRIPRNRVRRDLLPRLVEMAPGVVRSLARLAEQSADDEAVLGQLAADRGREVVTADRDGVLVLDTSVLATLPPALARRVIRSAVGEVAPAVTLSAAHLAAAWRLAGSGRPSARLDLPGVTVEKYGDALRLAPSKGRAPLPAAWPERELPVPGVVWLPEAGVEISAEAGVAGSAHRGPLAQAATIRAASVRLPLRVRNRHPGDRFQPFGAPGRRKLQDVLVDRKIPRGERDRVPVVVDSEGHIVWVAGVAVAERGRVTSPEDAVLLLKQRKRE